MSNSHLFYFIENFELAYGCRLNWEEISIGYENDSKIILTKPEWEDPFDHSSRIIRKQWKGKTIPFLMTSQECDSVISEHDNGTVSINMDIVSSAWFLLSGKQELQRSKKDKYGRFSYFESIQKELNISEIPVVNYYFDILKEAIQIAYGINVTSSRKFSATITHDIDEITSGWKHRIRKCLENKQYAKAISYGIAQVFRPYFPWKNIKELADFNTSNHIPSTFFFLPRNNTERQIKNADYEWNNSYVKNTLRYLAKSEHEVGVHGSYKTHDSEKELNSDLSCFEQKPSSNRFHFLQFDLSITPKTLDSVEIKKDSSLGFQETIGFRNSVCTPFKLYNFETEKSFDCIEVPLNIMDCSLEFSNYMNLEPIEAFERIKNLVSEIKQFNGNVCVNWHNTYFSDYQKGNWKELYTKTTEFLISENCKFYTIEELK